jgi:tripartite-type tricarboxylate transporter receptor subunit TctC
MPEINQLTFLITVERRRKMQSGNKKIIGLILILIMVCTSAILAIAAEYPTKPISFVIPYPAGGSLDATGRALTNAAKEILGQPIICENKSGGAGTVGPSLVSHKPPDGYTLGSMISTAVVISYHMGKISFNPIEDVTHIMRYGGLVYGLAVRGDSPWLTFQDFVKYAKENPGKVTYGSGGLGSGPHLALEQLAHLADIKLVHIPYKGGAECNSALLGGHIDASSDSSWGPMVDAGKFRLLVVYNPKRSFRYPQVPTLRECGFDMAFAAYVEILGPKGLPKPIIRKLEDTLLKAMNDKQYQAVLENFTYTPVALYSDDLDKAVRQESEKIKLIVQKLGLDKK